MRYKSLKDYQQQLKAIDKGKKSKDYTSMLILAVVEEVGEMARAYLAQGGRKPSNIRAQQDESYQQELGDIIVAIMKLANIRNINLDKRVMATLNKIKNRKRKSKG